MRIEYQKNGLNISKHINNELYYEITIWYIYCCLFIISKNYFLLTLRHVPGTHAATINESMPIRGTLWQIVTMIAIIMSLIVRLQL